MRNTFITAIVLLFTTACVSTKNIPLDVTALDNSKLAQITLSKREDIHLDEVLTRLTDSLVIGVVTS